MLHDRSGSRSVVVCNGDPEHKHVYVSDSNTYTVEIQTSDNQDVPSRFLLKYEGEIFPDIMYTSPLFFVTINEHDI